MGQVYPSCAPLGNLTRKNMNRALLSRAITQTARRRLLSTSVQESAAGTGELQVFRPKTTVTRSLSPFELEVFSPFSKWAGYQKNAVIENFADWFPAAVFMAVAVSTSSGYHNEWARHHAMAPPDED